MSTHSSLSSSNSPDFTIFQNIQPQKSLNQHIIDYLDYFIDCSNSPEYAVLIRGTWGSGKSTFIRQYQENRNEKKFLAISLNGLTSFSEIEEALFAELHPILSSNGMRVAKVIGKGLLKGMLKIDLDKEGHESATVSADYSTAKLPNYLMGLDERVLVFDDLERCTIPIGSLLGFINQFVENKGLKVILLANELEILSGPTEASLHQFLQIKEKLIGKSFDLTSDFESAFGDFVQSTRVEIQKFLSEQFEGIRHVYNEAGYNNLRHLKQAILDFDRFSQFLPDEFFNEKELADHIVCVFFAVSFELKKGEITELEIEKLLYPVWIEKTDRAKDKIARLQDKYSVQLIYTPIPERLWTDFFKFGTVSREAVAEAILSYVYREEKARPDWIRLWYMRYLEDDEFTTAYEKVVRDFQQHQIGDIFVLVHVAGILLEFFDRGLTKILKSETIKLAKQNIDALRQLEKLPETIYDIRWGDAYGLGFYSRNTPELNEIIDYIAHAQKIHNESTLPEQALGVLELLDSDPKKFLKSLSKSGSKPDFHNTPVLTTWPLGNFIRAFEKVPNKTKYLVIDTFERRYRHLRPDSELVTEIEWLTKLAIEIRSKDYSQGTVSSFHWRELLRVIEIPISMAAKWKEHDLPTKEVAQDL